jgi:hypothetical protein
MSPWHTVWNENPGCMNSDWLHSAQREINDLVVIFESDRFAQRSPRYFPRPAGAFSAEGSSPSGIFNSRHSRAISFCSSARTEAYCGLS